MRLPFLIGYWTDIASVANLDYAQQVAKLCIGVVQNWITIELAIRIRNAKGYSDISEAAKKKLRRASSVLVATMALSLVIFTVIVIVSARKHHGYSFNDNACFMHEIFGYLFLC